MTKKTGSIPKHETPRAFRPLLVPSRYKGAYGGRGSGKSHFFAGLLIDHCQYHRGLLALCIREVQRTLKESSKRLIEAKLHSHGLGEAEGFRIFEKEIQTPGDGVIIFTGMQDSFAGRIKSLEGFKRAWIEEAQALSHKSLSLLRPTIRAKGSEIWASWNPERKTDAIDDFFRRRKPADAIVVQANWRDNPWFTHELEEERLTDLRLFPERYQHVWEGGYVQALEGAYFARALAEAKEQRRIPALLGGGDQPDHHPDQRVRVVDVFDFEQDEIVHGAGARKSRNCRTRRDEAAPNGQIGEYYLPGLGRTYLHPDFADKVADFIQKADGQGVSLRFTSGYRDQEKQDSLHDDPMAITPARHSLHSVGRGVDVAGWKNMDAETQSALVEAAKGAGLSRGGNYSKPDPVIFLTTPARTGVRSLMIFREP